MFSRDGTRQEIVGILSGGYGENKPKSCRDIYALYVSVYQVIRMNNRMNSYFVFYGISRLLNFESV